MLAADVDADVHRKGNGNVRWLIIQKCDEKNKYVVRYGVLLSCASCLGKYITITSSDIDGDDDDDDESEVSNRYPSKKRKT